MAGDKHNLGNNSSRTSQQSPRQPAGQDRGFASCIASNVLKRSLSTIALIFGVSLIFRIGPLCVIVFLCSVMLLAVCEIFRIQKALFKDDNNTFFVALLSWVLLFSFLYSRFGDFVIHHTAMTTTSNYGLQVLFKYHKFICAMLYFACMVLFVMKLDPKIAKKQFKIFFFSVVFVSLATSVLMMTINNVMKGYIWQILPVVLVAINDIFAYIIGKNFGKRKLIQRLSPNKTVEGFVGAAITTIIAGYFLPLALVKDESIYCPIKVNLRTLSLTIPPCKKMHLFVQKTYEIGPFKFDILPIQLHSVIVAIFASVVGPFGGFFASGYKRSIAIKDFGAVIPGHGGILDRVDCHIVVSAFMNFYLGLIYKPVKVEYVMYLAGQLELDDLKKLTKHIKQNLLQKAQNF